MNDKTIHDQRSAVEAAAPNLTPEACSDVLGHLQFIAPRSGNVHGVAWHGDALFVKFQGGKVYRYTLAPTAPEAQRGILRAHYDGILSAPSAGSYFAANVKGNKLIACQLIGIHAEAVLSERHENGDGI